MNNQKLEQFVEFLINDYRKKTGKIQQEKQRQITTEGKNKKSCISSIIATPINLSFQEVLTGYFSSCMKMVEFFFAMKT